MRTNFSSLSQVKIRLQIISLFAIVLTLEFLTPTDYVFGYLYTGPILLTNARLGRMATLIATVLAVFFTLLNIWVPAGEPVRAATIASRLIAVLSLVVTGGLSDRIRRNEEAISRQQTQIQAQAQLARLREDFASTLTHDLKTPLLGAIETINAFEQAQFGPISATQATVLATMKRSHHTSLQLVETLLDVYRNDAEGLILQMAPLDLTTLAAEVASNLAELAASRQVYIAVQQGQSEFRRSLWVHGDAFQLQRVLNNLVINAINHSPRGERVEIVLEPQAAYQVVKIIDRGAGIKPDEFPYLFERFFQGQSDRQAKGSGLGLYLSRQIVEAHNGTIWAENRVPTGAIFSFKLPTYPYQAPA